MKTNIPFRKTLIASGAAMMMAAVSSNALAADGDTMSQDISEARQESQIWTTFALNSQLKANDLKVSVDNGKATLTGTVEEDVSKDLAKQIALNVSGIKDVDNQIVVKSDYVAPKRTDRDFGQSVEDATITSAIKSKLLWSQHAEGFATNVDTNNGKVVLTGTADSALAKEAAGRLAMNTRGVASVDNKLSVKAGKPDLVKTSKATANDAGAKVSDSWITTKVKSSLLYARNVDGTDINVKTVGGVVTLSGKADSDAERDLAVEIAKNVRGVKTVNAAGLSL